ncbi:MAG: hypothetical protein ABI473_07545 [Candidatus Dormibacter sp.]
MPTRWICVRSALRRAYGDAVRFAFNVRVGLLFSIAGVFLTYLATHNVGQAAFTLLSFPLAVAVASLWFLGRNLLGWSSLWAGDYRDYSIAQGLEPKRLYLLYNPGMITGLWPNGIRCVVREPGGLTSVCTRTHTLNGFRFPSEFPELIPPAPGKHHAVWLCGTPQGRWWVLAQNDFEVAPMLVVS